MMDYDYDEYDDYEHEPDCPKRKHPPQDCGEVCKRTVTQKADLSTTVEIDPSASVGRIKTECVGPPRVDNDQCGDTCRIIVTQTISVTIPIRYNVSTNVGKTDVTCHA